MDSFGRLIACAGSWRGTNRLWLSPTKPADESVSVVTVTSVLEGRFVRIDQAWAYQGEPKVGSLLVGCHDDAKVVTAHWIDMFHMGRKVMACMGGLREDGTLDVRGSYAALPGADWSWRIAITAAPQRELRIVMHNIDPQGKEELAVEAMHSAG